MRSFTINALGPFSLAATVGFLERFPPASYARDAAGDVELAFAEDREWVPVGVNLSQRGSAVNGQFWGDASAEHVRRHVQRLLSLDVDGRPFPGIGDRDPVVAALQSRYPGLRPVCFSSPYEAAAWAVIGHGVSMREAAAIRSRLTEDLGHPVAVAGRALKAFPAPQRLAELRSFPGLADPKPEYLRAVAAAALAGELDGDRLRDLPRDEALARLRRIPGIGPLSAELVLIRGAGDPDNLARQGRHLNAIVGRAYDLGHDATDDELAAISSRWRPFRSWVSFLLRVRADDFDLV